MKPGWILLLVAALVVTVSVLSWRLGYRSAVAEAIETPKADTLIIRDTVTVETPVPILTTITDTLLVAYPDIVIIHDTTFVQLPKERKEYSGKDYRAVVSGYQPSLDLIQVFPETKVVPRTISVPSRKRSHFALSLQAGYGITIQDNRITPLPYIGAVSPTALSSGSNVNKWLEIGLVVTDGLVGGAGLQRGVEVGHLE